MALYFNLNYVTGVRVNDGSTMAPATIECNSNTYVRASASDYPVGGTSSIPYAWYCETAYVTQQTCYTASETPSENDLTYYPNGSFYSVVDAYTPSAPGFEDCYAMAFNGQGVWAVPRRLYLDYNTGLINSVSVSITTRGYEPTQLSPGTELTQVYDSSKYMYYVTVYPGDIIYVSAVPSAGHYITGGTGSYTISVDNSNLTVTITAAPESVDISGSLYDMYNEAHVLETYEIIMITNNFGSATAISSLSGCKVYVLDAPITLAAGETISLQAHADAASVPVTSNYLVTANTNHGQFSGWIQSSHT